MHINKSSLSTVWGHLVERQPNRRVGAGKARCVEAELKQCKKILHSLAAVLHKNKRNAAGITIRLCIPALDISPLDYLLWGYLKDRLYLCQQSPNYWCAQLHSTGDQENSPWDVGQGHYKLQCASSHSDSAPRSLYQALYKLLSCTNKMLVYEEKTYTTQSLHMSVRQAYEKNC